MYPTIFNIVVNAVVWDIFLEVYTTQESHHILGWAAREEEIMFYDVDGCII